MPPSRVASSRRADRVEAFALIASREHVANIGEGGATRRRHNGYAWVAIAAVAYTALLVLHAPRWSRLLLVLPIGAAAIGLLQAREKT
jgi:hypothetical protein